MNGALNRLIGRQARRPDARLLALTLNNMTQGVESKGLNLVRYQRPADRLLREEMAEQRGQLKVVTSILGISGESNKTIDVSEVIRKIRVEP